jgi:aspartate aminotransferase-like enzyme
MTQLRIPGPTPCPPEVMEAMGWPMINHRGPEFKKMLLEVTDELKQVYQTKNDLYILTGSGTGGLEAAVVNMLSPGEKVLSVSIGVFGERWANIARTFGADVVPLNFEWGQGADPNAVRQALKDNPAVTTVMVTHNETSTGVTNDLESIAGIVKDAGKLLLVDAISSMSSVNLPASARRHGKRSRKPGCLASTGTSVRRRTTLKEVKIPGPRPFRWFSGYR